MGQRVILLLSLLLSINLAKGSHLNINGVVIRVTAESVSAQLNGKALWKKEAAQYYFPNTLRRFKKYIMVASLESGAFTTTRYNIFDAEKGFLGNAGEKYLGELNGQLIFLEKEAPGLEIGIAPSMGINVFSLETQEVKTSLLDTSLNPKSDIISHCKLDSSVFLFDFDNIRFISKDTNTLVLSAKNDYCQFRIILNPEKSQLYVDSFKVNH